MFINSSLLIRPTKSLNSMTLEMQKCSSINASSGLAIKEYGFVRSRLGLGYTPYDSLLSCYCSKPLIGSSRNWSSVSWSRVSNRLLAKWRLCTFFTIWVIVGASLKCIELPKDITGGPWYSEQEFDVGFVDAVSQFVGKVLAEEVCLVLAIDM